MSRRRTRLSWVYNEERQEFTTPAGRVISLHEIAALLQDQQTSTHDFQGSWTGWRMRQNRLIPPGASYRSGAITPQQLRAFTRWLRSFEGEQAQIEFRTEESCRPLSELPSDHLSAETSSHASTPPDPRRPEAKETEDAQQQQEPVQPHAPRRRAEVIELSAYRQRVRAQ